mmetsp:Transcript_9704/g.17490  ORF Transcript_9704/g.17490 Transcript_9704/m.17490 type:complete len:90 (+) Transcript_9704:1441-1710(+)
MQFVGIASVSFSLRELMGSARHLYTHLNKKSRSKFEGFYSLSKLLCRNEMCNWISSMNVWMRHFSVRKMPVRIRSRIVSDKNPRMKDSM